MDKCETCKHFELVDDDWANDDTTIRVCHLERNHQVVNDYGYTLYPPEGFGCTFHELKAD